MKKESLTGGPDDLFVNWNNLGIPAWVVGPDSTIRFLNPKAEELLGIRATEAVGRRCSEVIDASDGRVSLCEHVCPHLARAQRGEDMQPVTVQIARRGGGPRRWVRVTPIAVSTSDARETHVVLTATDVDRWRRLEGYVKRLAGDEMYAPGAARELTSREREVLEMLADDHSQQEIADLLQVRYSTVRTHVQRILSKLGVHSIQAAVARHLLLDSRDTA